MERYDVKCPACGTENKNLYLKETDGWFICERCKLNVQANEFFKLLPIPMYTGRQLADAVKQS